MKRTIRENINTAYSLHDMNIVEFRINGDTLTMQTQYGMQKVTPPQGQPEGYVEFQKVDLDFCFVYFLNFTGNIGTFTGEKMYLKDFIERFAPPLGFSVIDETYGYNSTKYAGFLTWRRQFYECMIEIYHNGDMIFVTEE